MKRAISQDAERDLRVRVDRINADRTNWKNAVATVRTPDAVDAGTLDRLHQAYIGECVKLYFVLDRLFNGADGAP